MQDWPANSHMQWEMVTSWEPHEVWDFVRENPWSGIAYNYIKLKPNRNLSLFEKEVENLWAKYADPENENPNRILIHHYKNLAVYIFAMIPAMTLVLRQVQPI